MSPEPAFLQGVSAHVGFDTVAIVGVGMMGGSLGLELRARGLARRVIGIDRNADALTSALDRGAIDAGTADLSDGVAEADCVALAAPVGVIPVLLETLAPFIRPDALVTDLGSVKREIVAVGARLYGPRFVGGHPMAGAPETGVGAALCNLFVDAAWLVVRERPFHWDEDPLAARVAALALALGARPLALDATRHDYLVAFISHLPHVLAFSYAGCVADLEAAALARELAGGSYRDLTRVAGADPTLWRDIFHTNRDCLLEAIEAFETRLQSLKAELTTPTE
jgi:prephenate dehydrogenase